MFFKIFQFKRRCPTRTRWNVFWNWTIVPRFVLFFYILFYRIKRTNLRQIPRTGPLIFVANHQSFLDVPAVGMTVWDRPVIFLTRKSLFTNKLLAFCMKIFGVIPIAGKGGDRQTMRISLDELKGGGCVCLYPEGGRSVDGRLGPFMRGALMLAKKSKAPIQLVAVEGAADAWPRTRSKPYLRGRIMTRVGRIIEWSELDAMDRDEALDMIRRELEVMRLELRAELRRRSRGRYPRPGIADIPYWEVPPEEQQKTPVGNMEDGEASHAAEVAAGLSKSSSSS